jgi:transposase
MSITMIGLDTAKSVFQVHGVNETGKVEIKRKLRRSELIPFFEKLETCTVVMEACGAAHHWARILSSLGHEVKLIAPEAVVDGGLNPRLSGAGAKIAAKLGRADVALPKPIHSEPLT